MTRTRVALFCAALSALPIAHARDGDFVNSFGVQGREQIGFSPSLFVATSFASLPEIVVQPDGKLLVSAPVANTGSSDMAVLRLNANGTLDTNFGNQGQAIVAFDIGGSNDDVVSGLLLQPNGRIVLCGEATGDPSGNGGDFAVARLLSDGTLDTQFSADGKATVAFDIGPTGQREDRGVRCSLQADGKIVIGGSAAVDANNARMAVARLNPDGSRDTGFNGTGTATIDFGPGLPTGLAFSVRSLAGGATLLTGIAASGSTASWTFAQLDANGQLDSTFGNGGTLVFNPGLAGYSPYEGLDAIVLADRSIVAVGAMALLPGVTNFDYGIFKLTASGALDTTFGSGGGQVIPFDLGGTNADAAVQIVNDPQGRLVVVGFAQNASSFNTEVVRLTAAGELDPTFGVGGKLAVATAVPPASDLGDQGTALALNADGSILVGSLATASGGTLIGLAKLVGDTIYSDGFELP